ncbi:MAG: SUMF1/EgtB/PvdO family nonheme iron enzyme [Candidatus Lernaella stagnicola]|nr:SUMF1/EgtB/PvdO family nonheme iron enzyme [Candidatus Lernaella stagnicola]
MKTSRISPGLPDLSTIALVLICMCFCFGCREGGRKSSEPAADNGPQKTAATSVTVIPHEDTDAANRAGMTDILAALAALPKGTVLLVEDSLRDLAPPQVEVRRFQLTDSTRILPDKRSNPALAQAVLAPASLAVYSMFRAGDEVWDKAAVGADANARILFLATRRKPVGEQLAAAGTDADRYAERVSIPAGEDSPAFEIEKYEVTHARYAAFLNEMNFSFDEVVAYYSIKDPAARIVYLDGRFRAYEGAAVWPVFHVSWHGADAFCRHYGGRLPTFDEWKRVAGEQRGFRYPWGNETDFTHRANFTGDADGYPMWAPVDAFTAGASPEGVFNLAGNAYEWIDQYRVLGGAWEFSPALAANDQSDMNSPFDRNLHDGFRCVYQASGSSE